MEAQIKNTPELALTPEIDESLGKAERAMMIGLIFSGVRCVLQYAILPFVLPLIGVAQGAAVEITLVINIIAIVSIILSIRRFWRINYNRKWSYTMVGGTALVLLTFFIVQDITQLFF